MKMGFFSKFIKSIVDAKAYKYFYDERKGRTIGYLLLICLIFTSFISVKTVYSVNKGLAQFEKYFGGIFA
jgi:hypothetical protein